MENDNRRGTPLQATRGRGTSPRGGGASSSPRQSPDHRRGQEGPHAPGHGRSPDRRRRQEGGQDRGHRSRSGSSSYLEKGKLTRGLCVLVSRVRARAVIRRSFCRWKRVWLTPLLLPRRHSPFVSPKCTVTTMPEPCRTYIMYTPNKHSLHSRTLQHRTPPFRRPVPNKFSCSRNS